LIEKFARNYKLVEPMMRELAALAFDGKVWGASEPTDIHKQTLALAGKWQAVVSYGVPPFGNDPAPGNSTPSGGAVIAQLADNEFLVFGFRARVQFSNEQLGSRLLYSRVEEGHFDHGRWIFERVLNGDQVDWGLNFTDLPQLLRVKMASY